MYHRSLCVWLCVLKPVLEVEGEREEKEKKKRNSLKKKKRNKIEYLNKIGKKIKFRNVACVVK